MQERRVPFVQRQGAIAETDCTALRYHSLPHGGLMQFRDLAFTFVIALVSAGPLGADCATLALPDDFARSGAVFVGRVVAQSVRTTPGDIIGVATETTFDVEQSWKGKAEKKVRVQT